MGYDVVVLDGLGVADDVWDVCGGRAIAGGDDRVRNEEKRWRMRGDNQWRIVAEGK